MRQLSTRDQMTQKVKTIGHRMAFNNEQSPYCIVSYPHWATHIVDIFIALATSKLQKHYCYIGDY